MRPRRSNGRDTRHQGLPPWPCPREQQLHAGLIPDRTAQRSARSPHEEEVRLAAVDFLPSRRGEDFGAVQDQAVAKPAAIREVPKK